MKSKLLIYLIFVLTILQSSWFLAFPPSFWQPYSSVFTIFNIIGMLLVIACGSYALAVIKINSKKTSSTAFLRSNLTTFSTNQNNNASFRKRAEFYKLDQVIEEIEIEKKMLIVLRNNLAEKVNYLEQELNLQPELTNIQKLIMDARHETKILEEKLDSFVMQPNTKLFEHGLEKIQVNPDITKLRNDNQIFPKSQIMKLIDFDRRIYIGLLKETQTFVKDIKSFITIVSLQLDRFHKKLAEPLEAKKSSHKEVANFLFKNLKQKPKHEHKQEALKSPNPHRRMH